MSWPCQGESSFCLQLPWKFFKTRVRILFSTWLLKVFLGVKSGRPVGFSLLILFTFPSYLFRSQQLTHGEETALLQDCLCFYNLKHHTRNRLFSPCVSANRMSVGKQPYIERDLGQGEGCVPELVDHSRKHTGSKCHSLKTILFSSFFF